MHRTRGKVLGVALAVAATGLLAACGDNDSTASSTPTLTTTASAASSSVSSAPVAPAESSQSEAAPAPESPAPAEAPSETVAPERPAPVPTSSQDTSGLGEKDKAFLQSLQSQGISPSSPEIALSIGAYVCQGVASGASESDLTTFVTAMAGSDPAFDPAAMPVEQAGQIYISTAKQTYCQ